MQIPTFFEELFPEVVVEHSFGREFSETSEIGAYDLVIHCGGCMIDSGKLAARIRDLDALGVPYTNYGLFLSWKGGEKLLERVLKPWGLDLI